MYYRIKALAIKELLAVWRDKNSRIALIFPPLFQLVILSHAATLEVRNISIGYFNQDAGQTSRELINRVKGSPFFKNVYEYDNLKDVHQAINRQDVILSLQFPADFSRHIGAQKTATIQMLIDGRRSNSSQIVSGYIQRIIEDLDRDILLKRQRDGKEVPSIRVASAFRSWFNPNLDYIFYNIPCLVGILSMIMSLIVTGQSVAREREMGTFDQLLVSPLEPWQMLLGKMIPALIIAVASSTVIMVISMIFFGVPFYGSFILLYISMIFFIISILGIGLFISSLSQTQQQASLGVFVFMTPTILLSGYATPIENMPHWLQWVSQVIPITHFFIIVKGIFLKDLGLGQIVAHIWPMILISIFTLTAAGWMFGRRRE